MCVVYDQETFDVTQWTWDEIRNMKNLGKSAKGTLSNLLKGWEVEFETKT